MRGAHSNTLSVIGKSISFCFLLFSFGFAQFTLPDTVWIPVIFYDYHPSGTNDFEMCKYPNSYPQPFTGMVQNSLSPDRKPVAIPSVACNSIDNAAFPCACALDSWFKPSGNSSAVKFVQYKEPLANGEDSVIKWRWDGLILSSQYSSAADKFYVGPNWSASEPTNLVHYDSLPFARLGNGLYAFDPGISKGFFWLDGKGFGNEPVGEINPHNFAFTMELQHEFTYDSSHQILSFIGDDDVWIYINNQLVIDLGGVHSPQRARIDIDSIAKRIGLVKGHNYIMDIFFAERHTTLSTCYIATNLVKHPAPNAPPVFISTPNTLATEGNLWSYAIAADDINPGDSVTYSLQISPSGMHVTGKTVTWTPENADVGSHAITIRATDTHGAFNDQLFVVKVANVNQAPVITSPATSVAVQDQLFQYQAQASDTDAGDVLTWQLTTAPAGMTVSFTGLISWTPAPAQVGSNNIVLQVKDAANVAAQQIITITVSNVNDAPVITDPVTQIATEDIPFSLQLAATDPDGNQVFWFVIQGPDSLKVNMNTGLITWTPLQNVADSIVIVKIGAKDSALLDTMTFNISVAAVNDLPVITSVFPNTFKTDTLYSIPLTANDEEGNVITWTVAQKPATMNIISNVLVWAPSSIGSDTIVLIVSDGTSSDTLTSYFQVINGSATGISHSKYLPMPTDLSLTSIKSDGRISLRVGMPKDILSGTLNVYDIKGRIVATYHIGNNGWHTVQLPNISSGIFVARIIAGKKTLDIRIANH